jgi:crossover junction endodeoxyribonuclease RusA
VTRVVRVRNTTGALPVAGLAYVSVGPTVGMYLYLPEPPSSNRYWKMWRGRMVVSPEAKAYKLRAWAEAKNVRHQPFDGPVKLTLDWYRARRMGDLDNRLKVTLDALRGVLYHDDKQVVEIVARRHESPKDGRLVVLVERQAVAP